VHVNVQLLKLAFHDADTDILADTRDFLKLHVFLWQAKRHDDIIATILASTSALWNASFTTHGQARCSHDRMSQ